MSLENYFRAEAEDYLATLESAASADIIEIDTVRQSARALRGVARLAGEPRVLRAAEAFEQATRSVTRENDVTLGSLLLDSVSHFRVLVAAQGTESELDAHVDAVVDRCRTDRSSDTAGPGGDLVGEEEFRDFVRQEVEAIADAMEAGIAEFTEDPSNRDALGAILRRQRALLGSARLEEVTLVAEALRAVEDLAELIVRLNVPIKSEWLDVFRSARDVLRASAACLARDELPGPVPALSRLRTIREELVDRYGNKEPVARSKPAATTDDAEVVESIAEMRDRAARLRSDLLNAIGANPRARAALDELHDLMLRALR